MLDMTGSGDGAATAITFPAQGAQLQGTLFMPPNAPPRVAVVLNGATGVPHGCCRAFAAWLAETRGLACLTHDYRDFGVSARRHPRDATATMADWALLDQPAARAEMRRQLPGVPLRVIGHLLGAKAGIGQACQRSRAPDQTN